MKSSQIFGHPLIISVILSVWVSSPLMSTWRVRLNLWFFHDFFDDWFYNRPYFSAQVFVSANVSSSGFQSRHSNTPTRIHNGSLFFCKLETHVRMTCNIQSRSEWCHFEVSSQRQHLSAMIWHATWVTYYAFKSVCVTWLKGAPLMRGWVTVSMSDSVKYFKKWRSVYQHSRRKACP